MNRYQVARQIRYLLNNRKWEDDANNELVCKSYITEGPEKRAIANMRFPAVLIKPRRGVADPHEPSLKTSTFELQLLVKAEGDSFGEQALIGGVRDGQGSSDGRGLLEIEEEILSALDFLSKGAGLAHYVKSDLIGQAAVVDGHGYVVAAVYELEVRHTVARYYHPAEDLQATDQANGGDVDLTWALPPDRFDRRSVVLRRAAGSTPPSSASDGTGVTLSGDLATSVTDNTGGTGTFSYALFAAYREHINEENEPPTTGDPDRYAVAVTATVTVT